MSPLTTNLIQCSDCEAKSYRVHDPMHTFLKIHRPVDMPGPLESEFPIIPILYVIYILRYASSKPSTLFLFADIEIPLGPRQVALLRMHQVTLQVCHMTLLAHGSCLWASKQLIFATSHMHLPSATGICDVSLESGTAVRSVPRTFARIVRCSTPTTALTLSSCSRLLSICKRSGALSYTSANLRRC